MKQVQIKDGPLVTLPRDMTPEEADRFLREHPIPGMEKKDPGTALGTVLDVGRGAIGSGGIAGLAALPPRAVAGGLAAMQTGVEQIEAQSDRLWGRKPSEKKESVNIGREWLDEIDRSMAKWDETLDKSGPIGYTVSLGPLEGRIGRGIGGLIGGAAIPGGIAGQAVKELPLLARLGTAMKTGAAFGAAMEAPSVLASKDNVEFADRVTQMGVSAAAGGLLAGALHGTVEVSKFGVKKLLGMKSPETMAAAGEKLADIKAENEQFQVNRERMKKEDVALVETAKSYVAAKEILSDKYKMAQIAKEIASKLGKKLSFDDFSWQNMKKSDAGRFGRIEAGKPVRLFRGLDASGEEKTLVGPRSVLEFYSGDADTAMLYSERRLDYGKFQESEGDLRLFPDDALPQVHVVEHIPTKILDLTGEIPKEKWLRDALATTQKGLSTMSEISGDMLDLRALEQNKALLEAAKARGYSTIKFQDFTYGHGTDVSVVPLSGVKKVAIYDTRGYEPVLISGKPTAASAERGQRDMVEREYRDKAAKAIKEFRNAAKTVTNIDSELETIAEVIAARGLPVGRLWTAEGGRLPLDEIYAKEVVDQINRRVAMKQAAMKKMDPAFMYDEFHDSNIADIIEEGTRNLKSVEKDKTTLSKEESQRVKDVANEVLATQASQFQAKVKGAKEMLVNAIRELRGPISFLSKDARKAIEVSHGENVTRVSMAADQYKKELQASYTLEERQLPALMSDPTGSVKVGEIVIGEKLGKMLEGNARIFNKLFGTLVRRGILDPNLYWDNYVPRLYDKGSRETMTKNLRILRPLDQQNPHSFERTITDIFWAAQDHYDPETGKLYWKAVKPRTLDIAELTSEYLHSVGRTSAHQEAIDRLHLVDPDAFRWVNVGNKKGEIAPHAKQPPPGYTSLPDRFVNDSVALPDGRVEKMYVRNDVAKVLNNWHAAAWEGPKMAAFDKWNKWYKHVNLMVDLYHFWQLERGAAAAIGVDKMFGWGEGLKMLSSTHPENKLVQKLINVGTLDPYRGDWGQHVYDKTISDVKRFPGLEKIWDSTLGRYNEWLWQKVAPGLKVRIAVAKAHKLMETPGFLEKYGEDELLRMAGRFANDVAGGQSWGTHGRSAKFQSIANMVTLAPDWMETRMNLIGKGIMGFARGAARKSQPQDVLYRDYWTGYMLQGIVVAGAAQQMIYAAFPETRAWKEKAAPGWKGFTSIVFPIKNRRGEPLVMSPMPNLDYFLESTNDLGRFYNNRKSAALTLVTELISGRDYTGRPYRPGFFTLQNFLHTVGNAIPIPAGMVVGVGLNTGSAKPGSKDTAYELIKGTLRSVVLGLHNHNEYPQQLRTEFEWLVGYETQYTKNWVNRLSRFGAPGKEVAQILANRHNEKVRDWFKEASRTPYAASVLKAAQVRQKQLFITVPK